MKQKLIFAILILTIWICLIYGQTDDASANINNQDLILKLENIIDPFVGNGFVGVVLVADPNKIILNKAYGKSETNLDSNTTFWIASNTKPITAIAILKLVEDGKLSVKDRITKFFQKVPLDKRQITVEQLLTHSSGLPSDFIAEGEQNKKVAIKKILSQKLISKPGEKENYSNDGYDLLGSIIEIVSKKKYQTYIRDVIFAEAGMTSSNFIGDNDIVVDPPNDLIKYQPFYKKVFKNGKRIVNLIGSGGISSNTIDLYRMMIALKGGQILNQKSLIELFEPRIEIEQKGDTILSWAYGWVVQTKGEEIEIRHSGRSDWNHNSRIFFLHNGYIVIIWARDNGPDKKAWATELSYPLVKEINLIKKSN